MSDTQSNMKVTQSAVPGASSRDRLSAAERSLPRRKFFSDMPDKGLFAAFALVGFLGIMFLKVNGILGADLIAGLAVVAMVLYGLVCFQIPAIHIRADRLGDNFYYLGFIYTLASLSAALLQLRQTPDVENLLGNFGIALVTTVVGIAGRVLFVQLRGDLDAVEEHVRRDLLSASHDLRAQLVLALTEFETFHTGVLQASREAIEKATGQVEAQIGAIGRAVELGTDRIKAAGEGSDIRAERLAQLLERLTQAVAELPMMAKMEFPNERLEKQLMLFSGELEKLIAELRSVISWRRQRLRRRWYWPFGKARQSSEP